MKEIKRVQFFRTFTNLITITSSDLILDIALFLGLQGMEKRTIAAADVSYDDETASKKA